MNGWKGIVFAAVFLAASGAAIFLIAYQLGRASPAKGGLSVANGGTGGAPSSIERPTEWIQTLIVIRAQGNEHWWGTTTIGDGLLLVNKDPVNRHNLIHMECDVGLIELELYYAHPDPQRGKYRQFKILSRDLGNDYQHVQEHTCKY